MFRWWLTTLVALAAGATAMTPAYADPAADKMAIMQRFERWTAAFNV